MAGETANKAADAATKPTVPKNFKMPKQINSYADYLKYAGQANGIIPVTPEAEAEAMSPDAAPGPMSGDGVLSASCTAPLRRAGCYQVRHILTSTAAPGCSSVAQIQSL